MIRSLGLVLTLCMALSLFAADQFAADLRSTSERQAVLGLLNVTDEAQEATLIVYASDGTHLGQVTYNLGVNQRMEPDLVATFGNDVAWARIQGDDVIGFVRYEKGQHMSLVPITHTDGSEAWVSAMSEDTDLKTTTVLVNTEDSPGQAYSNPRRQTNGNNGKRRIESQIPGYGTAFGQTAFEYEDVHTKADDILWDRITSSGTVLTGVQHLETELNDSMAALCLPRTPYRTMIVSAMQPVPRDAWNQLVLINTNKSAMRVNIVPHYSWYGEGDNAWTYQLEPITIDMDAGEKRVFNLDVPLIQNIPGGADWFEIRAFEGGLLGYQRFGNDQGAMGAIETGVQPSARVALPFTPTNTTHLTQVSVLNTGEKNMGAFVYGFDDAGNLIHRNYLGRIQPYEKISLSSEELFGDLASQVTWMEVASSRGHIFADSVVHGRDGQSMAGLQGFPFLANHDHAFRANLERDHVKDLYNHGWEMRAFTDAGYLNHISAFISRYGNMVRPGHFYTGHEFEAGSPYFFLGYEPVTTGHELVTTTGDPERVALVSPPIEIPLYGSWTIHYSMRMYNPQNVFYKDRYGIMWRYEDSDIWHWGGVNGFLLQSPPVAISDCWEDIQWRNTEVTITPWWPMKLNLPPETAGRRIQVAYFYDHTPVEGLSAPWMFIDRIEINPYERENALYYAYIRSSMLTTEDLMRVEE